MCPPECDYDGQAQSAGPIASRPEIAREQPAANRQRVKRHDRVVKQAGVEQDVHPSPPKIGLGRMERGKPLRQ